MNRWVEYYENGKRTLFYVEEITYLFGIGMLDHLDILLRGKDSILLYKGNRIPFENIKICFNQLPQKEKKIMLFLHRGNHHSLRKTLSSFTIEGMSSWHEIERLLND